MNATITTATAQPTKLRDGSWGAKIELNGGDRVEIGTNVTVKTKAGKTWMTQVAQIVWSGPNNGNTVYIFRTTTAGGQSNRHSGSRRNNYTRNSGCQQCRAEGRKCWQCAFDDE